jgi:hypothetical protein
MIEHRNEKGELHRTDGPAVERPNGYREWWVEGKPHRVDGPAIEYADGTRAWFVNDKRHRVDGPAVAKELKEKNSEIEQLREALRFYAEWGIDAPAVDAIIEEDRGDKARAALNIVLANLENGD